MREKKIYSQTYIKVEESTRRRADSVGFILVHSTKVSKSNFHFWMTSKLILKSLRGNRQVVKQFKPKRVEMVKSVKQSKKMKELSYLKNSRNFQCLVKTKINLKKPAERKFSEIVLILNSKKIK